MTGVLLMAFGGPDSLEAVGPFCENLMGRMPSAEVLEQIKARYARIGGGSPLPAIAGRVASRLQAEIGVPVAVGMRYWQPSIAEGLQQLADAGVTRVVALSLSPFESPASSGAYRAAIAEAAPALPALTVVEAPSFRCAPTFVSSLADAARDAVVALPAASRRAVVFTAHSLPLEDGGAERYVAELRETTAAVAEAAGLPASAEGGQTWLPGVEAFGSDTAEVPWLFAYQSKGRRGGEWLVPDVADVLKSLAEAGYEAVAVSPVGFATDHMETLYDLDIDAAGLAADLGLAFARAAVPNDSDRMAEALASVVEPLLG